MISPSSATESRRASVAWAISSARPGVVVRLGGVIPYRSSISARRSSSGAEASPPNAIGTESQDARPSRTDVSRSVPLRGAQMCRSSARTIRAGNTGSAVKLMAGSTSPQGVRRSRRPQRVDLQRSGRGTSPRAGRADAAVDASPGGHVQRVRRRRPPGREPAARDHPAHHPGGTGPSISASSWCGRTISVSWSPSTRSRPRQRSSSRRLFSAGSASWSPVAHRRDNPTTA